MTGHRGDAATASSVGETQIAAVAHRIDLLETRAAGLAYRVGGRHVDEYRDRRDSRRQ
jgi:hypothetical protein